MFVAVFLITLGILLLLNNFQILPWNIWRNIIPFWPVLIIFTGIDMIFGKSSLGKIAAGVINSVIFLTIIAKVIGLNLPLIKNIPLPKQDDKQPIPQLLFTEKYDVRNRLEGRNFRKNFF